MQDLNDTMCELVDKGVSSTLVDTRDNHLYTVAKLKDGNCWMAENLDLGRTTLTTDLTPANTNLASTITAETFNSWKTTVGHYTTASGDFINISGTDATSGTPYGTLYNYYAASAGTISGEGNPNNATYDICPAGWRLPTGGSSGEFKALYAQYNSNVLMRAPIKDNGAAFALAGNFYNSAPVDQGSHGRYWSSTRFSSPNMYGLYLDTSDGWPVGSSTSTYGYSVRCVLGS